MEINPNALEFKGPFTESSTEYITLSNPTDEVLAFKVKTTAPKLYCVRPNASIVAPGQKLEVSIILQGLKEEPASDFKCRDKFLLVSLPCPYDVEEETSISELWPELEQKYKSKSVSKKIRVNYLISDSYEKNNDSIPASYNEEQITPATPTTNRILKPNNSFINDTTINDDLYSSTSTPAANRTLNSNDIEKEINDSNVKIAKLNEKLDSNVKSVPISQSQYQEQPISSFTTQDSISNGVSYPTALILALIAFLLGWLFF